MERVKDLHLALPAHTARELDRLARSRGVKRAHLLRQAVERYLTQAERESVDAALCAYVEKMAPHSGEFIKESAANVRRQILKETEW